MASGAKWYYTRYEVLAIGSMRKNHPEHHKSLGIVFWRRSPATSVDRPATRTLRATGRRSTLWTFYISGITYARPRHPRAGSHGTALTVATNSSSVVGVSPPAGAWGSRALLFPRRARHGPQDGARFAGFRLPHPPCPAKNVGHAQSPGEGKAVFARAWARPKRCGRGRTGGIAAFSLGRRWTAADAFTRRRGPDEGSLPSVNQPAMMRGTTAAKGVAGQSGFVCCEFRMQWCGSTRRSSYARLSMRWER